MPNEILGITETSKFNGAVHILNYLNYLYRTDKGQKWTNGDTCRNRDHLSDGGAIEMPSDYSMRREYKLEKHRALARIDGAESIMKIRAGRYETFIVYFTADSDPCAIAADVYDRAAAQDRWVVDAVVSHLDQGGYCHLHVLGHLAAGLRRRPGESLPDALYEL